MKIRISRVPLDQLCRIALMLLFFMPFVGINDFRYVRELGGLAFLQSILRLLRVGNLLLGLGFALLYALTHRTKPSVGFLACVFPYSYLVIRTFLAGGRSEVQNLCVFIMMLLLYETFFLDNREWLTAGVDALNLYTLINFVFILRYAGQGGLHRYMASNGRWWGNNYFLGYDNSFIVLILPLIVLNLILYHYCRQKRYLIMALIQLISELIVVSVMSLVAVVILAVYLILRRHESMDIFFRPGFIFAAYLFTFLMVVVARFQETLNTLLLGLVGKGIGTSRLILWQEGLQRVEKTFWFGEGYTLNLYSGGYTTPHNMLLEWLNHGGIFFTVGMVAAFYLALRKLRENFDYYESPILFGGIVAMICAYMAEGYGTYRSYWIVLIMLLIGSSVGRFHELLQDELVSDEY